VTNLKKEKVKNSLFGTVVRRYAMLGIREWKLASTNEQNSARARVGYDITEAEWGIHAMFEGKNESFIPMPRGPEQKQIERAFFRFTGETPQITFNLFKLAAKTKEGVALRFEPDGLGTHTYAHFQFSEKVGPKGAARLAVPWVPDSYPAFPCGVSDPIGMFFYMATSVHGYEQGFMNILIEMLQEDGINQSQFKSCTQELQKLLGLIP